MAASTTSVMEKGSDQRPTGVGSQEEEEEIPEFKEVAVTLATGERVAVLRRNIEEDLQVDASFFDEDYTVAAATGCSVWEGSYYMLAWWQEEAQAALRSCKVLELGSGTGLLGLAIATLGARTLLTDVKSVVREMLDMNIARNSAYGTDAPESKAPDGSAQCSWPGPATCAVGHGWAAARPLDWTVSLEKQFPLQEGHPADADVLIGAETVWLKELIEPYVVTVVALLEAHRQRHGTEMACYMCYRNRGTQTSTTFATTEELMAALRERGCVVTTVAEGVTEYAPDSLCTIYQIALGPVK
ncbi:uncharacterized protein MONBRDRAFT_5028 [Monosiga brevicollis MX1]|uniref:Uncharacterized protein n=1 Tax=Monosiga brevicollis TaxID=81824 RepID=A9UPP4_MONBE|nr:uncharacterized protein MONBRDRAFT_5028 [Monosiga brevicollis MX1]EDQ92459.1 predicted protein [Monosiga brevicollis MX1]|eukprot:XP_001742221.1 hypothetical protein [Monosiga brevicollis MX1]